ncbi:hypothetical protein [Flavobacterium sp. UBA6195]|uniref:hypothetical protein n=1 Tax=Flavobacterium sp. UBA6195 TaxID=1946554 RepID=UPI0025C552C8|nr:hypothetical protein [Flavobacterium sp. UBA6195]
MSKRLVQLSYETLKYLPKLDFSQKTFKLMAINRNKKIVFVELTKFELVYLEKQVYTIHSAILPDDLFVLAIFNEKNQLHQFNTESLFFTNLSLKEVYFYGKEMHDLDWLYEGDFRKKDSYFYIIP